MHPARILLLALTLLGLFQAAWFHDRLPAEFGTHFDARGVADRTGGPVGFLLVQFAALVGMAAVFLFTPRLMRRVPTTHWNLPNKDYWLAPERRAEFEAWFAGHLAWIGCATQLLLVAIFHLVLTAATSESADLMRTAMPMLIGGFLVAVAVWIASTFYALRRPAGR
jgi:uncharacterized membrane protein